MLGFLLGAALLGFPPQGDKDYLLKRGDVVLVLGDSITVEGRFARCIFHEDLAKSHPDLVLKDGRAPVDFKGPGLRFILAAQSGHTAADGLARLPKLLEEHKPTVAVVFYGLEDRVKDPKNYAGNMRRMTKKLKEAGVKVTLLTPAPVDPRKRRSLMPYTAVVAQMALELRKVAAEEGVALADVHAVLKDHLEKTGEYFTWDDGLHPNSRAHRIIADTIQSAWGRGGPRGKPGAVPEVPAPAPPGLAEPKRTWNPATTNLGGVEWTRGGVQILSAIPGSRVVIAALERNGLWSSENGGATWSAMGRAGKVKVAHRACQIVYDPENTWSFWVSGTHGQGIYATADRGKSFKPLGKLKNTVGIAIDFTDPDRRTLLAGSIDGPLDLHKSSDRGETWERIGTRLPVRCNQPKNPIILDDLTYIVACWGADKKRTNGIFRTEDGGETWKQVSELDPTGIPLVASDGAIYWALLWRKGLIKSVDQGKTWTKLGGTVFQCPIEIGKGRLLSFSFQQLYSSRDGGKTWKPCGIPMPVTPLGIVYSEGLNAVFGWRATKNKEPDAIFRGKLPE